MPSSRHQLTLTAAAYLILATILWGCNAIVGRWFVGHLSPALLNLFRWMIAAAVLMPFGWKILLPQSALWLHKKRFVTLSLLGVGCYNAFLYIALETSSPLNVTLIG
ncbi:MAG: DMT family transporter, partial [Burkholderiaceae bacterium]